MPIKDVKVLIGCGMPGCNADVIVTGSGPHWTNETAAELNRAGWNFFTGHSEYLCPEHAIALKKTIGMFFDEGDDNGDDGPTQH